MTQLSLHMVCTYVATIIILCCPHFLIFILIFVKIIIRVHAWYKFMLSQKKTVEMSVV